MWKRVLVLVVAVSAHLGAQRARGSPIDVVDAQTRAELEQARDAIWRSWFAGDVRSLERIIPGALAAGSPESWEDRAATITQAKQWAADGGKLLDLRFDSTRVTLHGNVAVMYARYLYTVVEPKTAKRNTISGRATEVFVREKGRWVNPFWYLE